MGYAIMTFTTKVTSIQTRLKSACCNPAVVLITPKFYFLRLYDVV